MRKYKLVYLAVFSFVVSLFFAGFVSTPSMNGDGNHGICQSAIQPNAVCYSNIFRTFFALGEEYPIGCFASQNLSEWEKSNLENWNHRVVSREAIAEYCQHSEEPSAKTFSGFYLLFLGAFGVFAPWFNFAWFANLLGFFSMVFAFSDKYRAGLYLGAGAFILSFQSYLMIGNSMVLDEGGVNKAVIARIGVGCVLWQLSFLFLTIFCFRKVRNKK